MSNTLPREWNGQVEALYRAYDRVVNLDKYEVRVIKRGPGYVVSLYAPGHQSTRYASLQFLDHIHQAGLYWTAENHYQQFLFVAERGALRDSVVDYAGATIRFYDAPED